VERFAARFERYGFRRETMFTVYGLAESVLGVTFLRSHGNPWSIA